MVLWLIGALLSGVLGVGANAHNPDRTATPVLFSLRRVAAFGPGGSANDCALDSSLGRHSTDALP